MGGKHYVILVHGTWGYQRERYKGPIAWYKETSTFVEGLCKHFGAAAAAQWEVYRFTWEQCGDEHEHRFSAANDLANRLDELRKANPGAQSSFVAHSHGGNVVLEALSSRIRRLDCRRSCRVVEHPRGTCDGVRSRSVYTLRWPQTPQAGSRATLRPAPNVNLHPTGAVVRRNEP